MALIVSHIEEWWKKISTRDTLSGDFFLFVLLQLFEIFTKVNGRQDPLFWPEEGLSWFICKGWINRGTPVVLQNSGGEFEGNKYKEKIKIVI